MSENLLKLYERLNEENYPNKSNLYGNYTLEEQHEMIEEDWKNLKFILNQYEEVCIEAVKDNGLALLYVNNQPPEICLEAIKENGESLQYVSNQTPEICLEAVKEDGRALEYVKEQTIEICVEAVKEDGRALKFVKYQSPKLCELAITRNIFNSGINYVKHPTFDNYITSAKYDVMSIYEFKNISLDLAEELIKQDIRAFDILMDIPEFRKELVNSLN